MQINLANTRLFRGMEPLDIEEMLDCLHAKEHAFQKGEIIFPEGTATEQIGVVRAGARMDFFACNERAQVFFSRQTTHFNLFAKIAIFTLI